MRDCLSHKRSELSPETKTETMAISYPVTKKDKEWTRTLNKNSNKMRKKNQVRNSKMNRMRMTVTVIFDDPIIYQSIDHINKK